MDMVLEFWSSKKQAIILAAERRSVFPVLRL